jgi:hypothetical protein
METLRNEAFKIFLQHALASALLIESVVTLRAEHVSVESVDKQDDLSLSWTDPRDPTVTAAARWVRYCRNAQTLCGVFGLAAIDRAETAVYHRLQYDCSFGRLNKAVHSNFVYKFEKVASCYVNALKRQQRSDSSNAALWGYAGTVYDHIDAKKLLEGGVDDGITRWYDVNDWENLARGHESGTHSTEGYSDVIAALRTEIAVKFHTAVASAAVSWALAHLGKRTSLLNSSRVAASAECLEKALGYSEQALQWSEFGEEELHALWKLCASYMRNAAEETTGLRYNEAYQWSHITTKVADLAERLAAIMRAVDRRPAETAVTTNTEVKSMVNTAIRHIKESPLVSDPMSAAAKNFDSAAIVALIDEITSAAERKYAGKPPEQQSRSRLLAAADKVHVDQSPAHPHIKRCWLSAAEQMRLAVASTNEKESKLLKFRSAGYEKIALGPLATAAEYFAKAARAVTEQAAELWTSAAKALMVVTVSLMERCCTETEPKDMQYDLEEERREKEACELAEAADCYECVYADAATTSPGALHRLRAAELQLRLAVLKWTSAYTEGPSWTLVYIRERRCLESCRNLLSWCSEQQRMPSFILPPPGAQFVSAEEDSKAERAERVVWLCETLTLYARMYAVAEENTSIVDTAEQSMRSFDALVSKATHGKLDVTDSANTYSVGAAREAVRAFLDGNAAACLVWRTAGKCRLWDLSAEPVQREIYNRLIRRAWELRSGEGEDAAGDVGTHLTRCEGQGLPSDPQCSALIDTAVEAMLERQRQLDVSGREGADPVEKFIAQKSVSQYLHCVEYIESHLSHHGSAQRSFGDNRTHLARGIRAGQAGKWYASAVRAAAAEQCEIYEAFKEAASYVEEPSVHPDRYSSYDTYDCARRYAAGELSLASKVGERFASAAEALLAGDRDTYELWLKAAEATVRVLQGDGDAGVVVENSEALAQAAQQQQGAASLRHASLVSPHVVADAALQGPTAELPVSVLPPRRAAGEKRKWEGEEV